MLRASIYVHTLVLVKGLTNVIQRVSYDKWPDSRGETSAYKSILLSTLHGLRPLTEAMDRITYLPKFLELEIAVSIAIVSTRSKFLYT